MGYKDGTVPLDRNLALLLPDWFLRDGFTVMVSLKNYFAENVHEMSSQVNFSASSMPDCAPTSVINDEESFLRMLQPQCSGSH